MGIITKINAGGTDHLIASSAYGTCTTAANTAAKVVTLSNFDTLTAGVTIHVRFTNSNTAASPTLNVNSKGAKSIYAYGTTAPGTTVGTSWQAGAVVSFTYNTDNNSSGCWVMNNYIADTDTDTDTKVTSSANHYTPSTASGNDKTASASGATAAWSIDVVKGITINTDGKGHITGLSVTSGKIPANPNTNTTYSLSGALSSHKFTSTLTAGGSGSGTSTSDFTLAAGTGITITDDTSARKMTIALDGTKDYFYWDSEDDYMVSMSNDVNGNYYDRTVMKTVAANYNHYAGVKPWFSTTGASTLASGSAGTNTSAPSINARSTTSGKYYAVEIDKNGRLFVNVPWTDVDTKVSTAAVTSGTTYYPIMGTNTTTAETKYYDSTGINYHSVTGTASGIGSAHLTLGNSTPVGTAGNKYGAITLYSETAYKTTLFGADELSSNVSLYLPTKNNGVLATTSDLSNYLPLSGGTLSNIVTAETNGISLAFQHVSSGGNVDTGFKAVRSDTGTSCFMGVGSGGVNHGIWSHTLNKWLLYADDANVYVNGARITPFNTVQRATGTATVNAAQTYTLASLSLAAGKRFLVLGYVSEGVRTTITSSCHLVPTSGTASVLLGGELTRVSVSSGQGVANWRYVETGSTSVTISVRCYGYYTTSHTGTGHIVAICLGDV